MRNVLLTVILFIFSFFVLSVSAYSQTRSVKAKTVKVKSYTTKKGTHVNTHYRSKPGKWHSFISPVIDLKRKEPCSQEKNVLLFV